MTKAKKKFTQKELKQPDTFQTKGEQVLEHFVNNRKRYLTYLAVLLALILIFSSVRTYVDYRNSKISAVYAEAFKVYQAKVVDEKDKKDDTGKDLTYPTDEKKYLAASQKFEALISQYGSSDYGAASRFYLANCLFKLKRYGKAREKYEEFLSAVGADYDEFRFIANHDIAQCYDAEGKLEEAMAEYRKILASDVDVWKDQATYQIAMIYKRQGKLEDAIKWFEDIGANYPESSLKPKVDKILTALRGPVKPEEKKEAEGEKEGEKEKTGDGVEEKVKGEGGKAEKTEEGKKPEKETVEVKKEEVKESEKKTESEGAGEAKAVEAKPEGEGK